MSMADSLKVLSLNKEETKNLLKPLKRIKNLLKQASKTKKSHLCN